MDKININYVNVMEKIKELDLYTELNLVLKIDDCYGELFEILEKEEGMFKNELIFALNMEKEAVCDIATYMRSIYDLIRKSSSEFREVDENHAEQVSKYLTE